MRIIAILMLALLSSGCTTTMYVAKGNISQGDKDCTIQTHWYKTDYVIGSKSDEFLSVEMGERRPVTYNERDNGITYRGENKRDIKVIGTAPTGDTFVCGEVLDLKSLKQFEGDELALTMFCKAKSSPFAPVEGYLPARNEPYVLHVSKEEKTSLTSTRPDAPQPPTCSPK